MKNNNALKFIEGAAVGLALGVAATLFMSSKTGKKLREETKETLADFYKYIAPKVKAVGKMGQQEYREFMAKAAEQYGKAKKMSEDKIRELVSEAQESWNHFFGAQADEKEAK